MKILAIVLALPGAFMFPIFCVFTVRGYCLAVVGVLGSLALIVAGYLCHLLAEGKTDEENPWRRRYL